MFWKPLNGVPAGEVADPPPSQLISRRPVKSGPGALALLGFPRAARKASTPSWMAAALAPASVKRTGAAETGIASRSIRPATKVAEEAAMERRRRAIRFPPWTRNLTIGRSPLVVRPTDIKRRARPARAAKTVRFLDSYGGCSRRSEAVRGRQARRSLRLSTAPGTS